MIYQEKIDPAVTRSIEIIDNADSIGFQAKVTLGQFDETLAEINLLLDPADVRRFIAELTEIADKRGL